MNQYIDWQLTGVLISPQTKQEGNKLHFPHFMELGGSLPHSQESTTCPYLSQINPFLCPSYFRQEQLVSFLVELRTYQHPGNRHLIMYQVPDCKFRLLLQIRSNKYIYFYTISRIIKYLKLIHLYTLLHSEINSVAYMSWETMTEISSLAQ